MKYLLDTNILVDHLRGKTPLVLEYLKSGSGISVITQAELYYGAKRSASPLKNLKKVKSLINDLFLEVFPLSEVVCQEYAGLKADLEKKGQHLDDFDLLIAATALDLKLTLVTRDKKHFPRIKNLRIKP